MISVTLNPFSACLINHQLKINDSLNVLLDLATLLGNAIGAIGEGCEAGRDVGMGMVRKLS